MIEICCYIIHSNKLDKFYIGACQNSLADRINKHNNHFYGKNKFTAKTCDWLLFLKIDCNNYAQAIRIEKKIKAMKSKVFIQNLKKYPELIEKLLITEI